MLSGKADSLMDGNERRALINGNPGLLEKEVIDEESTASGGKVEKEQADVRESSHLLNPLAEMEETSRATNPEPSKSETNTRILEMEKKIKDLEHQLEVVVRELKSSESEKVLLKSEVDIANEKLEKVNKHCEELEHVLQNTKDQIVEVENKHHLQLRSLEDALTDKDMKHKELLNVKEAFTGLFTELESSRKKMKELEEELVLSASEVRKLEELSKHGSSQSEMKSIRAAEPEKMLQLAQINAKDMENHIYNLQKELQRLQGMVEENKHVEDTLWSTKSELSVVLDKLELSKSQMMELERKLVANDAVIQELSIINEEKETLRNTVADLKTKLSMNEEICSELEAQLNLAEQKFEKADSLLSQELAYKEELEEKLKLAEQLHQESKTATETSSKRNLELQDLIRGSNAAEEHIKMQLRETEMRLATAEKQNMELEQQLNLAELKYLDAEGRIEELDETITELTIMLKEVDEESTLSKRCSQGYEYKIGQLESSLSKSFSRNSELEKELNGLVEKVTEHEGRVSVTHQRSLELENLVWTSRSKAEDAEKRLEELELMLKAANYRTEELENLLGTTEAKLRYAEAEARKYSSKTADLFTEMEAYQARSASLEAVVQAANEKEMELTDNLNVANEERKKFEDLSNVKSKKLSQAENMIQLLQNELKPLQSKVEKFEDDLESSNSREKELLEKLRYVQEQLEHRGKAVEELTTRNLELNALNESLINDSELKLRETATSNQHKESEVKELRQKLVSLGEEREFYKDQTVHATEEVASLLAELEANAMKLVYLESTLEEFKKKVLESDIKVEQTFSENIMLTRTNSKIREELVAHHFKVNELNEMLNSIHVEKEATSEQLSSHIKTIESLTDKHSRGLELQLATESRLKETEAQLQEAIEKYTQRDLEARNLNGKLIMLEKQLDQFQSENEGLTSRNLSVSEELDTYQTRVNDLQTALHVVITEKEETYMQLHSARKELEALRQQLSSDKEELQSQMTIVVEEHNNLKEMYQKARKELEANEFQLEQKANEGNARQISLDVDMENLKAESDDRPIMQVRILELEQKLSLLEKTNTEEEQTSILQERDSLNQLLKELQAELNVVNKKELDSCKELERQVSMKQSPIELETEHHHAILLEKQVKELKQKLQEAESQYNKKVNKENRLKAELDELRHKLIQTVGMENKIAELENNLQLTRIRTSVEVKDQNFAAGTLDGIEVKQRDLGVGTSTVSRRKSNTGSEELLQAPKTTNTHAAEHAGLIAPPGAMAFKFIVGVSLVSIIFGFILGMLY